jgi:hypothetical protein
VTFLLAAAAVAQDGPAGATGNPDGVLRERYVPADELDTVFSRDARGVMLKRTELEQLLRQARENVAAAKHPAPIVIRQARYSVQPGAQQARVEAELSVQQFEAGWQLLRIPAGNLSVEKATINDQPAVLARDPGDASVILIAHQQPGAFILTVSFSTPLAVAGSDQLAAFQLSRDVAVELVVQCPADRRLIVNDRELQRPAEPGQPTDYRVPVGGAPEVRLRWTSRQQSDQSQTLAFVRTEAAIEFRPEVLQWSGESMLSVFGGTLNRLVARVPPGFEVVHAESTGLESWTLADDPEQPGFVRLTLTWRQPFSGDRAVLIRGVAMTPPDAADASRQVPAIEFVNVASHAGRLLVRHTQGLRLVAETSGGIRAVSATEASAPAESQVFDFWQQQYKMTVAVRTRARELFADSSAVLEIRDVEALLNTTFTFEVLNAPLFEIPLVLPPDWQLTAVRSHGQDVPWTAGSTPADIVVRPAAPVQPGSLLPLSLTLQRALADPETEQRLVLAAVQTPGVTSVGGVWTIQAADDLAVVPLSLAGLTPIAGSGVQQVFRNDGTPVSGELAITRRPARIASRSVLRTWADNRQQTVAAEVTVDVLSGTIRSLEIRIPESLGTDVRFAVQQLGRVPGMDQTQPVEPVEIAEQIVGETTDGLRSFTIRLSRRFSGSLTLRIQAPRIRDVATPLAAPQLQVAGAVRQHGLLVFEAAPDQSLAAPADTAAIPGLFPADASLVSPPDPATGRRIALAWRFIRPDYSFQVADSRYDSTAVPSAICEHLHSVCTVNESGNLQRSVVASFQASGVQTLRFRLPDTSRSSLWSTILNDEPVEVREADGDYLVALPATSGSTAVKLALLFETAPTQNGSMEFLEQQPVQFLIDARNQQAVPIDVLRQTCDVHYPESAMIVDSDGPFRAADGLDDSGWLEPLSNWKLPNFKPLLPQLFVAGLLLLILFVLTALISLRRWKTLAAMIVLVSLTPLFLLSTTRIRSPSLPLPAGVGGWDNVKTSSAAPMAPAAADSMLLPAAPFEGGMGVMGGLGGFGGGGGIGIAEAQAMGGQAGAEPGYMLPNSVPSDAVEDLPRTLQDNRRDADALAAADEFVLQQQAAQNAVPVSPQQAARRKGARLSVNVSLEIPAGYRQRSFVSVADSLQRPAVLQLVIRSRSQLLALRGVAAAALLLLLSRLRRTAFTLQLSACLACLLMALAAVPVVPPAWQGLVDGAAIGSAGALLLVILSGMSGICCGPYCPLTWCRQHCLPKFFRRTAALVLIAVCVSESGFAQESPQTAAPGDDVRLPEIVVPWSPDQPPLRADRVFIPHDEFIKLFEKARPQELPKVDRNPIGSTVVSAWIRSGALSQADGEKHALRFEARFAAWCDSDDPTDIPLPLGAVGIRSIQVNGAEGVLIPLTNAAHAAQLPDFAGQQIAQSQQQQTANAAPPAESGPVYAVRLAGRRMHVVDVVFDTAAEVQEGLGRSDLALRNPPAGTLEWTLPADGLDARVNGRSSGFRRDGRTVIVPIAAASTLRLQWLPTQQQAAGDTLFHAETISAISVQDSGLFLRTTVDLTVRQGEISELEITLPDGFSPQTVSGEDLAGWSIEETDAGRIIRIPLRRNVTDRTAVTFRMFAPLPAVDLLQKFSVPISSVRGAGRDAGSVVLLSGPQFQVRSDTLSGVSQLNPDEAPRPPGDEFPGRPMLAWRYTRQPASIAVRISPAPDEQTVNALHAVRLEEQRQLWTSRFTLQLRGAARSRLDLLIPRGFLPLDVAASGLKDWYVTESLDAAASVRTLSIQLDDARTGSLQVALQGQQARDPDRQQLTLQPPILLGSTSAESQLAVWLDAASESAGLEEAGGWTLQPPSAGFTEFREVTAAQPSLMFRSTAVQPGTAVVRLRPAVSTLIAESVTLASVTPTSLEIMLGLKWQIARAAADTFAVELPDALAAAMSFDIPGQRRLQRESAGAGRTRILFQLQQPASEQLFVLGTASLPLPADGRIQSTVPAFAVPPDAPSTLSGQSHFLVIVNQSIALLQPEAEQPDDVVAPEQITTRIPQTLLDQAVRICRLHPETSAWKISYPEQQKVAPAIVSLATHTTVLAEDGSWRSRHQLRVINESRQFLPVLLPDACRLLFCTVDGRPSRVVVNTLNGQTRHLIPIPQSGNASTGFDVDFAIAGRFTEETSALRKRLAANTLAIPVPSFPEFRDDPASGISISRNRWSIYVPESWQAVLNRTPELTNVVKSVETELQDAVVLSEVEQAMSFFGRGIEKGRPLNARIARGTDMLLRLQQLRGNSTATEQARGEALRRLEEFQQQSAAEVEQLSDGANTNQFLFEQDLQQNRDAENSRSLFFSENGLISGAGRDLDRTGSGEGVEKAPTDRFWFGLNLQLAPPVPPPAPKLREFSTTERGGAGVAPGAAPEPRFGRSKAAAAPDEADKMAADFPMPQSRLRRQLANQKLAEQLPLEKSEEAAKQQPLESRADEQKNMPQSDAAIGLARQEAQSAEQAPAAASPAAPAMVQPEGRLSLLFELPTEGTRLDFLRVGGNPILALDIRSADSVQTAAGLAWTAACTVASLLLLTAGLRKRLLTLLQIAAVAGFLISLGGLCTPSGSLQAASIPAALATATLFAVARVAANLRKSPYPSTPNPPI